MATSVAWAGCGADDGPTFADDHPRIYLNAHRDRLAAELSSGRPAATKFRAAIDRWVDGADLYGVEGWHAALLGQLTGDAKYCRAAVEAVDAYVTSEVADIRAGKAPSIANDDYLQIGPQVGDLALVYDWCNDEVGDRRAAWLAYANQAVYNVWNYQKAVWGSDTHEWEGWAVDDPANNYYYSFLRATMLLGLAAHDEIPTAAGWLVQFRDTKIKEQLVPTFNADLVGGGSREGTGYGVSLRELFHLYDVWAASTGEDIATLTPHTRASMLSFIHQAVPTLDRIAPTGDQSRDSTAALFDYHRHYLQELIYLFPDDKLAGPAQALLAASSVPEMENAFMYVYDFLYDNQEVAATSLSGLGTAYYAPGIGELYARSGWDKDATWINLIAGSYTQSHAHQDQGSLMIYKGAWLSYDAVVDSKSGLRQELDPHSLVRIVDGKGKNVEQLRGTDASLVALQHGAGYLHAAAEITPAYGKSTSVQKVQRELVFVEPNVIVVYDRVKSTGGSQIWQLVTPVDPQINGNVATVSNGGHSMSVQKISGGNAFAKTAMTSVDSSDFKGGYRIDETMPAGDNRFLHVISLDGAATAVTSAAADTVSFTADGKAYTVQFAKDAVGATLTIDGTATTLGSGIDQLPE